MSLTGLGYDACSYRQSLKETMAPGMYFLGTPLPVRDACDGPEGLRTDAASELLGLPRRETRCGEQKYSGEGPAGLHCKPPGPVSTRSRHLSAEDTRMSNPPSTLRGSGVNRWAPLCEDPQSHALEPFDFLPFSDRRNAKDQHTTCATDPLPPDAILPPGPGAEGGEPGAIPLPPVESFPPVPMLPDHNECETGRSDRSTSISGVVQFRGY